ncbi:MAG: hypothetical protein NZ898_14365 [Myxococcota bacterium]|nr:hypothetical protein [Myxococcota bacterium]
MDIERAVDELRGRGFGLLPSGLEPRRLEQARRRLGVLLSELGEPPLHGPRSRWLRPDVETAPTGLAIYALEALAPEIVSVALPPPLREVARRLLGPDATLELVGALLYDEHRPRTEWETHLGGPAAERWREAGRAPPRGPTVRIVAYNSLESLDEDDGWLVLPRRGDEDELRAPPADESRALRIALPAGTLLLLDERTWHRVPPPCRAGRHHFLGAYLSRADVAVRRLGTIDTLWNPTVCEDESDGT